jgi:acetate---CoA ligase (ADP-forming) subunit beta
MELIHSALKRGQKALSEFESKQFIKAYGITVTREVLATSVDEAVAAAKTIGYPVALKACSPLLMHKSESGVIALGIRDDSDVHRCYERICSSVNLELEGVLVQEMVAGQRELVLGLNRDPQFGPCVMLGLGGVMTEILRDSVFRVAPFDRLEALDMMAELLSHAIFDAFRGQAPADREAICRSLIALGQIGLDHAAIAEIDINPMIIDAAGRPVAVDALVVLSS